MLQRLQYVPSKQRGRAGTLEPPRNTAVLPRTAEELIKQGKCVLSIASKIEIREIEFLKSR